MGLKIDSGSIGSGVVRTANEAMLLVGQEAEHQGRSWPITCAGRHRNGRDWVGLGWHENDNGREVVAPAVAIFLPAHIDLVTRPPR